MLLCTISVNMKIVYVISPLISSDPFEIVEEKEVDSGRNS